MSDDLIKRKYAMYALCNGCEKFKQCNTDNENWCDKGWVIRSGIPSEDRPSDGVLFKGNLKEGNYVLIKTTDGWVLDGADIAFAGSETVDRPQGEWIKHDEERDYCSRCKHIFKTRTITQQDKWTQYIDDLGYNFCPNCGSRNRKENE